MVTGPIARTTLSPGSMACMSSWSLWLRVTTDLDRNGRLCVGARGFGPWCMSCSSDRAGRIASMRWCCCCCWCWCFCFSIPFSLFPQKPIMSPNGARKSRRGGAGSITGVDGLLDNWQSTVGGHTSMRRASCTGLGCVDGCEDGMSGTALSSASSSVRGMGRSSRSIGRFLAIGPGHTSGDATRFAGRELLCTKMTRGA